MPSTAFQYSRLVSSSDPGLVASTTSFKLPNQRAGTTPSTCTAEYTSATRRMNSEML
jgi:hypothetical protein